MKHTTEQLKEANQRISDKLEQAQKLVSEAEEIADEFNIGFSMDLGGYGMGGWYEANEGWQASSQSC